MKTKVILIVIGALGTVPLEKNVNKAGTTISVELLQNTALLGTAHTEKGPQSPSLDRIAPGDVTGHGSSLGITKTPVTSCKSRQ